MIARRRWDRDTTASARDLGFCLGVGDGLVYGVCGVALGLVLYGMGEGGKADTHLNFFLYFD